MRYTAREIAQEQDATRRAAMLVANLICDIRGSVVYLGATCAEDTDADVIANAEKAGEEIDWAGTEALGAIKVILDKLGVRSMDADLCEECIEGREPRQIDPTADAQSENLAVIWLLAEQLAGGEDADPEEAAALITETREKLRSEKS